MTCYPTQVHYPDTERTSPGPILIMLNARLGSAKYPFLSHWFDSTRVPKLRGLDSDLGPLDSPIFQNARRALYSLDHPDWFLYEVARSAHHKYHTRGADPALSTSPTALLGASRSAACVHTLRRCWVGHVTQCARSVSVKCQ